MTRRGPRSADAIARRDAAGNRRWVARQNGDFCGVERWERRHGVGRTFLTADCANCDLMRSDVDDQPCNLRFRSECLEVAAIMRGVASYGACRLCGCADVVIRTIQDQEDLGVQRLLAAIDSLGPAEARMFRRAISN